MGGAAHDEGGEAPCFAHLLLPDGSPDRSTVSFRMLPDPPYRLDLTVWALRRRPGNTVDRWDAATGTYERTMRLDDGTVDVAVRQQGPPSAPELVVRIQGRAATLVGTRHEVVRRLDALLGVRSDLSAFGEMADDDPHLGPLADRFRGVRPPRFPTWIEALVNAVSCQQVSLVVGIRLMDRLAQLHGERGPSGSPSFPTAEALAASDERELRELGYSTRKGRVIVELARSIVEGSLDLDGLVGEPDEVVFARLCELYGIGPWSAEYVMLRGMGRLHVFPGDDVGARNKLRRLLGSDRPLDAAGARELVAAWEPFAGMGYFHLLLDGLGESGTIS